MPAPPTAAPAPTPAAAAPAPGPLAPSWQAEFAALAAGGGRLYAIDPALSQVSVYVFRGGRAPRLGHNHVLRVPDCTGYLYLPEQGEAQGRLALEFSLERLELDPPALRARLGPAFASELTPQDVALTRAHMLGAKNLQALAYPYAQIRSLQVRGEAPHLAVQVALTLHGRTRELWLPITLQRQATAVSVQGSFIVRQSDFDVQPYTALGGLLAVQDEIIIEFALAGQ